MQDTKEVPGFTNALQKTRTGIPSSLRPFFQEYVFQDLDLEHRAFIIIERTLTWGDVPELRWLFATYGWVRLAEWVRRSGWYLLPRRRFLYWRNFFAIDDYESRARVWTH